MLLITTQPWPFPARLFRAMQRAGFEVGVACPPGHSVCAVATGPALLSLGPLASTAAIGAALAAWAPDLVVPCDDRAVGSLHALHRAALARPTAERQRLAALIEHSLGAPDRFAVALSKGGTIEAAEALGLPVPPTRLAITREGYQEARPALRFPHVLKRDSGWGGTGVAIVTGPDDIGPAWRKTTGRPSWVNAAKLALRERSIRPFIEVMEWCPAPVMLQDFIEGRPANRAVACYRGEVLAGLSVAAIETVYPNGPASVVRIIDHPEMTATAIALVRALGLSGLCGFDFVIDSRTGRALLLELNPRATPICHLAVAGVPSLAAALFARLTGTTAAALSESERGGGIEGDTVAMFPGEWFRDPASPYLRSGYHDVPWEDPDLIRRYCDDAAAVARVDRCKKACAPIALLFHRR